MKKFNKYIALGLGALTLASCESLDTEYLGSYVSSEQKQNVLEMNPEMAIAAVTGCSTAFSVYETVYANHFDFGYPAIMIGLDLQTNSYGCIDSGYNWFSYWEGFTSPTPSGTPSGMAWYHLYDQIFACNVLAGSIAADTEEEQLMFFRAQAVGIRAFDYWVLAQLYQFNYAEHQNDPCVPIVTDENSSTAAEGNPRATVQQVYDQILKDLNEAIDLLSRTSVTPEAVIDSKPKRLLSVAAAYGLRARVHLTMHNYAAAASDAQMAISLFKGAPYSIQQVSVPAFANIEDNSWMWGIAIDENDRVVTSGIVNFPSMVCSFCGNGYVSVGAWKYISNKDYADIPNSDVRKGWWLDELYESPILTPAQTSYLQSYISDDVSSTIVPYTNVKFNSYQGVIAQSTNANDIPLMRVEEMYYILAEAQAMTEGVQAGLQTYKNFTMTYRNPGLRIEDEGGMTVQGLVDRIYKDRCIEFWGEGLTYFDMMRLGIGVNRVGTNFPAAYTYDIPNNPTDGACLIYCIPQGEINGNDSISEAQNNPSASRPNPVR